jgi:hypothetical protein
VVHQWPSQVRKNPVSAASAGGGNMRTRRVGHVGQATTETLMMMSFLLLLIFGFIQLSLLMATKYMVNYSAFAAARARMVGAGAIRQRVAAFGVMDNLRWRDNPNLNTPIVTPAVRLIRGRLRSGVTSRYSVPARLLIAPEGFVIESFSAAGPDWSAVPEVGDNAE